MIKFWYFVIQNLDKACYINFLIGTLVQLWVACPHYLLISSKHRIRAEKDYNLWTDFRWCQSNIPALCNDKQVFAWDWDEIDALQSTWLSVCYTFMISIPPVCRHHPATHQHTIWSYTQLDEQLTQRQRLNYLSDFTFFSLFIYSQLPSPCWSLSHAMWVPCIIKVFSVVSVKLWKPPSDMCMPPSKY